MACGLTEAERGSWGEEEGEEVQNGDDLRQITP